MAQADEDADYQVEVRLINGKHYIDEHFIANLGCKKDNSIIKTKGISKTCPVGQ